MGIYRIGKSEFDKSLNSLSYSQLSEEVYTIEGDSYKEIRARLYQRYVLDPMHEREEAEYPALTYEVPERPFAAARAIRETKGDDK